MTDNIIDHLLPFIHDEMRMPAGLVKTVIDEIERLRQKVQDLRMYAEQDACEIERLRADRDRWHDIANGLATHIEKASSNNARALQDYDNMVYKEIYGD